MKNNGFYRIMIFIFVLFFVLGFSVQITLSSDKKANYIQNYDKDKDGKLSQEEYPGSKTSFNKLDQNQDGYLNEAELQKSDPFGRMQKEEGGGGYIQKFDKDKDGKLSKDEYRGSETAFKRMDQNQDGYIDENEAPGSKPFGQPQKPDRASGYIRNFDKDKDGKISKDEYRGSETAFNRMDKNQDGFLDETELKEGPPHGQAKEMKKGGGYIQNFDKDNDGKISKDEYRGSEAAFKRMDQNNDGYIDENEAPGGKPHGGPQGMKKSGGGYMQNFDKNNDGKVSREEYPGSETAFKRLDKNNDGYIDENEAAPPMGEKKAKTE